MAPYGTKLSGEEKFKYRRGEGVEEKQRTSWGCIWICWLVILHLLLAYAIGIATYMWLTVYDRMCITEKDLQLYAKLSELHEYANETEKDLQAFYNRNLRIGDYKISAETDSHGYWKLCNGSSYSVHDYPELFDVLGYTYGNGSGESASFSLPDGASRVLGISSGEHEDGTVIGSESVTLNEANLPSHSHVMFSNPPSCSPHSNYSGSFVSWCRNQGDFFDYGIFVTHVNPTMGITSAVGGDESFSVVQPTIFIGNLFIYAGRP